MWPIAKSVKRQVRSAKFRHIVKTTIRLSHNAVGNPLAINSITKPALFKYENMLGIVYSKASFWSGLHLVIWLPFSFYLLSKSWVLRMHILSNFSYF